MQDDPLDDLPQSEVEWRAVKALQAIRTTGGDGALASFLVRATKAASPPSAEIVPIPAPKRKRVPMPRVGSAMMLDGIPAEAVRKQLLSASILDEFDRTSALQQAVARSKALLDFDAAFPGTSALQRAVERSKALVAVEAEFSRSPAVQRALEQFKASAPLGLD